MSLVTGNCTGVGFTRTLGLGWGVVFLWDRAGFVVTGNDDILPTLGSGGQSSVLILLSASNLLLVTMLQKANASTTASSVLFPSSTAAFLATGLGMIFPALQQCAKWPVLWQFLHRWFQALHSFALVSLKELLWGLPPQKSHRDVTGDRWVDLWNWLVPQMLVTLESRATESSHGGGALPP